MAKDSPSKIGWEGIGDWSIKSAGFPLGLKKNEVFYKEEPKLQSSDKEPLYITNKENLQLYSSGDQNVSYDPEREAQLADLRRELGALVGQKTPAVSPKPHQTEEVVSLKTFVQEMQQSLIRQQSRHWQETSGDNNTSLEDAESYLQEIQESMFCFDMAGSLPHREPDEPEGLRHNAVPHGSEYGEGERRKNRSFDDVCQSGTSSLQRRVEALSVQMQDVVSEQNKMAEMDDVVAVDDEVDTIEEEIRKSFSFYEARGSLASLENLEAISRELQDSLEHLYEESEYIEEDLLDGLQLVTGEVEPLNEFDGHGNGEGSEEESQTSEFDRHIGCNEDDILDIQCQNKSKLDTETMVLQECADEDEVLETDMAIQCQYESKVDPKSTTETINDPQESADVDLVEGAHLVAREVASEVEHNMAELHQQYQAEICSFPLFHTAAMQDCENTTVNPRHKQINNLPSGSPSLKESPASGICPNLCQETQDMACVLSGEGGQISEHHEEGNVAVHVTSTSLHNELVEKHNESSGSSNGSTFRTSMEPSPKSYPGPFPSSKEEVEREQPSRTSGKVSVPPSTEPQDEGDISISPSFKCGKDFSLSPELKIDGDLLLSQDLKMEDHLLISPNLKTEEISTLSQDPKTGGDLSQRDLNLQVLQENLDYGIELSQSKKLGSPTAIHKPDMVLTLNDDFVPVSPYTYSTESDGILSPPPFDDSGSSGMFDSKTIAQLEQLDAVVEAKMCQFDPKTDDQISRVQEKGESENSLSERFAAPLQVFRSFSLRHKKPHSEDVPKFLKEGVSKAPSEPDLSMTSKRAKPLQPYRKEIGPEQKSMEMPSVDSDQDVKTCVIQ